MSFFRTLGASSVSVFCLLGLVMLPGNAWNMPTNPSRSKAVHTLQIRSQVWKVPSCGSYQPQRHLIDPPIENKPRKSPHAVQSYATQLQQAAAENSEGDSVNKTNDYMSWWPRVKGYFLQNQKDNDLTFKQRLAKMGVATVLSYGMISNLSYAILISLAWYGFSIQVCENRYGRSS